MTLTPVATGPALVVCSTCRVAPNQRVDTQGSTGGARLAAVLRAVQQADPHYAGIAVQDMPCLFACSRHCVVYIRAPGRIGYVLGDFTPDEAAARAILDYAVHHAASSEGIVGYADWPEGVKGHFLVRTPPEGFVAS